MKPRKELILIIAFSLVELYLLSYITAPSYILDFSYAGIGLISFYVLISSIQKKGNAYFKINKKLILLNIISIFLYGLTISKVYQNLTLTTNLPIRFLLMVLALTAIITSLLIFVNFSTIQKYKKEFLVLLPLSFSITAYPSINAFLWSFISAKTCFTVWGIMQLLGFHSIILIEKIILKSPVFNITINSSCSGLEGILLFITFFSFIQLLKFKDQIKTSFILASYLIGTVYMYFLNVLRIVSFFSFGYYMKSNKLTENPDFIVELFHSNIGWTIYVIGIAIFLVIWNKISNKYIAK